MAIYINNNGTAKRMDGAGDGSLYAPVTSVATPENGNTASKTYAVGEMFIRGGKLCTCLVAIAQGGTFVKDTNYKEGDVGSVLTELNSNCVFNINSSKIKLSIQSYTATDWTANSNNTVEVNSDRQINFAWVCGYGSYVAYDITFRTTIIGSNKIVVSPTKAYSGLINILYGYIYA